MLKYLWLQMISMLQSMQSDDGLWRGSITIITKRLNMAHSTVYRLWELAVQTHATGDIISPEINSWKKLWEAYYISDRVHPGVCQGCPTAEEVYPKKTCNVNGVSKTTVHHWIVGLTICVHCNSFNPVLTEENKVASLLKTLHFRDPVDPTKYNDMLDQIHLDEKWFFLTWEKERYLLLL